MNEHKNTLTVIRGIPGSGKSTFAKRNFNCLILENDMYHMKGGEYHYDGKMQKNAIDWCIDVADMTLRNGSDVCVANTFTKKSYIDCYKRLAELHGADFRVYRMNGEFENTHSLNECMVGRFRNSMEDYNGELYVYPSDNGAYTISENSSK